MYRFTVKDQEKKPRAAVVHAEDAAALASFLGDGATIFDRESKRVWIQSSDQAAVTRGVRIGDAGESFDAVAEWFQ